MASDPGYIWVGGVAGIDPNAGPRPVPTACPECGRPTVRRGNSHKREVYCAGMLDTKWDGQRLHRKCHWRASVYHGEPNR